jgi:hypothetical protein
MSLSADADPIMEQLNIGLPDRTDAAMVGCRAEAAA